MKRRRGTPAAAEQQLVPIFHRHRTFGEMRAYVRASMRAILGNGRREPDRRELLDLAAVLLRALLQWPLKREESWRRVRIDSAAYIVSALLIEMREAWESGHVLHLEEWLGWRRPRHWSRNAARKRADKQFAVYLAVIHAMDDGVRIPGVFEHIGRKHGIGASTCRDWYYEVRRRYAALFPTIHPKQMERHGRA